MKVYKEHPAIIIDPRFKKYSQIKTNEKILIRCLRCSDEHYVKLNNFFTKGNHQCKNCTQIKREKFGHPRKKITVNSINQELKVYNFELLDTAQNILKEQNIIRCPNGHQFSLSYISLKKRINLLKIDNYTIEDICSVCKSKKLYLEKKEFIDKCGFQFKETFDEWKGVKQKVTTHPI